MSKKHTIIAHEKPWQSVFNDVTTFGFLLGSFWVNDAYLNGSVPNVVLVLLFVLFVMAKMGKALEGVSVTVTSREEALSAVADIYGEELDPPPE